MSQHELMSELSQLPDKLESALLKREEASSELLKGDLRSADCISRGEETDLIKDLRESAMKRK